MPKYITVMIDPAHPDAYTTVDQIQLHGFTVPAGFRCDGCSVPRFFWRFIFPPGHPKALRAGFLHDFIYRTRPVGVSRRQADRLFLGQMIIDGVAPAKAYLAYLGVRLCGWIAWLQMVDKRVLG